MGVDDIEDIFTKDKPAEDVLRQENYAPVVITRPRKKKQEDVVDKEQLDQLKTANVPGVQKLWTKTFGCSHNVSDGEYMEGSLTSYGYQFTENKEDADLWLINSCTVKDPSQAAFMNLVKKGEAQGKGVVVSGCVPQADRNIPGLESASVVGITQIDNIVDVVEETLKGNVVRLLGKKELPTLNLPKVRKNPLVEIVPLSTGCLGSCTYCKTKHARGQLGSYDPKAITDRVEQVLTEGVKEIWLSSEDTGAYGKDIGADLPSLLRSLTKIVERYGPEYMLRVGMTNPPFILDYLDQIAEVLRHPNVYAFLHVPVQAASDSVLLAMNREYTVAEFRQVADYLIKHVPGMTVATDIICGFPGETEDDFQETLDLVDEFKFPVVNISQFYPRPGTPAAKMKRINTQIVKNRSRRVTALFESYTCYDGLVTDEPVPVWVGTEVSKDGTQTVGHTKSYVKVLLDRNDDLVGRQVLARIVSAAKFHVVGTVVSVTPSKPPPQAVEPEAESGGEDGPGGPTITQHADDADAHPAVDDAPVAEPQDTTAPKQTPAEKLTPSSNQLEKGGVSTYDFLAKYMLEILFLLLAIVLGFLGLTSL